MAPEKAEVEVKLGVPVERMWNAAKQIQVLMPKALPDVFTRCDLDGDGGPGSIRVYYCGPADRAAAGDSGQGFSARLRPSGVRGALHEAGGGPGRAVGVVLLCRLPPSLGSWTPSIAPASLGRKRNPGTR
jgi:hypothetical protein